MTTSSKSDRAGSSTEAKKSAKSYTLFLPFLIVMVVLILTGARETASLHKQKMAFLTQNQQSVEALDRSAKQMEALQKLKGDLHTLAGTDPVAAKIMVEYFPSGS